MPPPPPPPHRKVASPTARVSLLTVTQPSHTFVLNVDEAPVDQEKDIPYLVLSEAQHC